MAKLHYTTCHKKFPNISLYLVPSCLVGNEPCNLTKQGFDSLTKHKHNDKWLQDHYLKEAEDSATVAHTLTLELLLNFDCIVVDATYATYPVGGLSKVLADYCMASNKGLVLSNYFQ